MKCNGLSRSAFASTLLCVIVLCHGLAQSDYSVQDNVLREVLKDHRAFVSIPNVSSDEKNMMRNYAWAEEKFEAVGFNIRFLDSESLPVFFAERRVAGSDKTVLFYLHIDGQAVNADNWDQEDPFVPVLKRQDGNGSWEKIPWESLDSEIDDDWRVFGRAAADDKAPIMMLLTALQLMQQDGQELAYNVKIILDPQEESSSHAFLSTLEEYKSIYSADYLLIMDGPAHPSNRPTLTLGCRGIATCSITVYGAKLPQHSGHYGNYVPNPVFMMSHLLASMKDDQGRVTVEDYYEGIKLTKDVQRVLATVPDDDAEITRNLYLAKHEMVGANYQEAMQYPTLNVRHIESSWKGPGLKTVIPEYITAHLDLRLVSETDVNTQIDKVRRHIENEGFYVIDREPTDEERLQYSRIATFRSNGGVNAFRTDPESEIVRALSKAIAEVMGDDPIKIRTMGGTVPIIEAIRVLDIEAVIVPMVNMDNNQHNPNENIRIGNIRDGIPMCRSILVNGLIE